MKKKVGVFLILASSVLAGIGQLLWKNASLSGHDDFLFYLLNISFLAGCVFYFFATILMMLSFRYGEYSLLFPMLSLSYIWVTLFSVLLFEDEVFKIGWILGAVVISLGVSLLSLSKSKEPGIGEM